MLISTFSFVRDALGGRTRSLLWMSFVMNGLLLTGPLYMMLVYDRVLGSESLSTLLALTALMATCYALWGYLDGVRGRILTRVSFLFEDREGREALSRNASADAQQVALEDTALLTRFLSSPVVGAFFDLPWTPIFFAALFLLHWSLGLVAVLAVVFLLAAKFRHDANQRAREEKAAPAADKLDARTLAGVVKRDGDVLEEIGAADRLVDKWRAQARSAAAGETALADDAAVFASNTKAFRMFLQSAILGVAAYLVIYGEISAGSMIAGSILLGRGLQPIEQLIGQYRLVREAGAASKRRKQRLAAAGAAGPAGARPAALGARTLGEAQRPLSLPKPNASGAAGLPALAAQPHSETPNLDASFADSPSLKLEVQNLHYILPGQRQPSLAKVNFDLYRGEVLSIIGETGSSKSLLGEILIGRRKPSLGAAKLGGRDLSDIAPSLRGTHIGYLSQSPRFLPGNVAETISRFEENAESERVIEAAGVLDLHDALETLPQGYRTDIAEAAKILPAGLAQRIYLARAIYEGPDLVVFDEPANNLGGSGLRVFDGAVLDYLRELQCMAVVLTQSPTIAFGEGVDFAMVLSEGRQVAYDACEEVRRRFASGAARNRDVRRVAETGARPLAAAGGGGARAVRHGAPPPPPKPAAPGPAASAQPPRALGGAGARPPKPVAVASGGGAHRFRGASPVSRAAGAPPPKPRAEPYPDGAPPHPIGRRAPDRDPDRLLLRQGATRLERERGLRVVGGEAGRGQVDHRDPDDGDADHGDAGRGDRRGDEKGRAPRAPNAKRGSPLDWFGGERRRGPRDGRDN